MVHRGFLLRLKPGAAQAYRALHIQIPPPVERAYDDAGILEETIFEKDGLLFVHSVARDDASLSRARDSEAGRNWALTMSEYLQEEVGGTGRSRELTLVYHHQASRAGRSDRMPRS